MNIHAFAKKYRLCVVRGEDGEPVIGGKLGHIYEHGGGLLGLLYMPNQSFLWARARGRLQAAGFTIWQDGDAEGSALFDPDNSAQVRLAVRVVRAKRRYRPRGKPVTTKRARELVQISIKKRKQRGFAGLEATIGRRPL